MTFERKRAELHFGVEKSEIWAKFGAELKKFKQSCIIFSCYFSLQMDILILKDEMWSDFDDFGPKRDKIDYRILKKNRKKFEIDWTKKSSGK